jgi:hypothetical protein
MVHPDQNASRTNRLTQTDDEDLHWPRLWVRGRPPPGPGDLDRVQLDFCGTAQVVDYHWLIKARRFSDQKRKLVGRTGTWTLNPHDIHRLFHSLGG